MTDVIIFMGFEDFVKHDLLGNFVGSYIKDFSSLLAYLGVIITG